MRAFLVLIALMAVGLGWISYHLRVGQLHESIADKAANHGALIRWKLQRTEPVQMTMATGTTTSFFVTKKGGPDWMMRLGVEPVFQRMEAITFRQHSAKQLEALLQDIEPLDRIKILSIDSVPVSESHIERLLDSLEIETLAICNTSIGRRPMPCLRESRLTWLSFHRTQLSDVALDDLPETLTHFDATRTRITDDGLDKFVRLKSLKTLVLRRTPTSQAAIEKLQSEMPWCNIAWEPLKNP